MNGTLLNADVLLLVFALANRQTKLALMSTCRVLYKEGGKQFLKSIEADLGTGTHLRSFLRYMDADEGSRMCSLHRLNIHLEEPPTPGAAHLTNMLDRLVPVSQLTHLTFDHFEALLSAHPPLGNAIARMTSIKEIDFSDLGKLSLKMLRSMRSKVETARLYPGDIELGRSKSRRGRDALKFLRQFSPSLRGLTVHGGGDTVDHQDDDPQYPLVSTLTLYEPVSPTTWHFVRAFPNLKNLTVDTIDHGTAKAEAVGLRQFRAGNIAQLRQHGCWDSLDTFYGTILMLWLTGLPCPISKLRLFDDCVVKPYMLRDILGAARAPRLDIKVYKFSLFLDEAFIRAFGEGCGPTVKVLSLTLEINPDEYIDLEDEDALDLGDVLDGVTDVVRSCSALESVALCIDFHMAQRLAPEGDRPLPAEVYAQEMDLDAVCATLHEAVPSAHYVRVTLTNHRKRGEVMVEIGQRGCDSEWDGREGQLTMDF